jgi:hypothetical protein
MATDSQSIWRRARDVEAATPLLAAIMAIGLAALFIPGSRDFPLDDAWIHLAYAKSLRLGDGLSYNPGDLETGFSSPLWVLVLASLPLSKAPVLVVKLLGSLLHGLCAWLAARLALDLAMERASLARPLPVRSLALMAGTLVASTPTLLQAATSGMEVPLASALVLASALASVRGLAWPAAALAGLAVLARPEALFFVATLGVVLAGVRRLDGSASTDARWRPPLLAVVGAVLGLSLWVAYCLVVSGHPWPNTQYVKGGGGMDGLAYVVEEVMPWQAWLVSITGVWLLAQVIRFDFRDRRFELSTLVLATAVTVVAIATSRELHPGVLFYESRYFAIVAAIVPTVLPFGLVGARRLVAVVLVVPIAVVTGLQVGSLREIQRAQEHDTHQLHTAVARYVAENLPADSIVAVEGAGAMRFFTPRTMTIVDLVGLNDRGAAHLHSDREAKLCHFVERAPTHVVMPSDWRGLFADTFDLTPLTAFDDPSYTQVRPPRRVRVVVYEVRRVRPEWRTRCEAGPG